MYKILDPKQANELRLRRHGWLSPEYELTDEKGSYGKLSYSMFNTRRANVVTISGSWTFEFENVFSRAILIIDQNGVINGRATQGWFSRKVILTMETGFTAEFYRPAFFWLWEYIWDSPGYGKIMRIKSSLLSIKSTVYLEQSMAPAAIIPLLIFLGAHLTLLRRRRRAQRG